jgi:aryl-alcohol dehydrogenase-like predicted oxidoreductase
MAAVQEGKVRAIGVSNFGVDLLARCEAIRRVDSLQPPFSLINRPPAAHRSYAPGHRTGVIAGSLMQSG